MTIALDFVLKRTWAITEDALQTIASVAARENEYRGNLEALQARLGRPLGNTMSVTTRGGVAILPVEGPLFAKANLMTELSGATSTQMLALDFQAAIDNPSIHTVLAVFATPGGEVAGTSEFARLVYESRGKKRLVAYVADMAASAGYWSAAAFDKIIAADTAMVGSIGVQMGVSVRDPKAGERAYQFISSQSPDKNAGPDTDAGARNLQKIVDDTASVFVDSVALYRGIDSKTVLESFGKGAVYVAAEALSRGMIDGIGTLEGVISSLTEEAENMDYSSITAVALAEARPDLVAEFKAQGANSVDMAAVRSEAAAAERTRIADIEALAMPGAEQIIADAKADPAATTATTAIKVLTAVRNNPQAAAMPSAASAALAGIQNTEATLNAPAAVQPSNAAPSADQELEAAIEASRAAGVLR